MVKPFQPHAPAISAWTSSVLLRAETLVLSVTRVRFRVVFVVVVDVVVVIVVVSLFVVVVDVVVVIVVVSLSSSEELLRS